MTPPKSARAVIIGGGVIGCSVAYHLIKRGWQDVVLLERKRLTSGTTWHAAGLVAQLRASSNMTRLAKYTMELIRDLADETGVETGFRRTGSMTVAKTEDRLEEIRRQASMARVFGVEVEEISLADAKAHYPHLNVADLKGAVHLPNDGQADPANVALALAKGARMGGAQIIEQTRVTAIHQNDGAVTGVDWIADDGTHGSIKADYVVNCGGMWGREVGLMAGVSVPLQACEHFYIVTEPIDNLQQLPVLRVPDECAYYKEDAGKILLGAFEPVAKPWGMNGIPADFEFDQLPEDFDHFEPILEAAVNRMPMLQTAGIHTFFNGPESFTPDDAYHLGEAPNLRGFFVAAGFNSIGIQSSGGAGSALAHWMDTGSQPFDLGDVNIARMQPFQNNRRYLVERTTESLGLLYADHWPYRQKASARGVRRSPLHGHLMERGAVFGETAGWERANWFANDGQTAQYAYSWGRQNWFENSAAEHRAVRENVGLYDMSSFGKLRVEGPDAATFLNRVCAAQIDMPVGRIAYTQFLNDTGGIEADVTVTRLSETAFLIVTPAATRPADQAWLNRHLGDARAVVTDVTAGEAVCAIMGPNARKLLRAVTPNDLSNAVNPFGTSQEIELGLGLARVHRVSYVGELGWEIYTSSDMAAHVFETLIEAGQDFGLKLCGMHMMDSCRIEKAFRHFGHDISCEDHVLEAGLGFAVKTDKPDFVGRQAVLAKRETGLQKRLVQFLLEDPEPLLFHNEPVLRNGEYVGYLSSGNYGHTLGGAVGLGYVPSPGEDAASVLASSYEIEIAGKRFKARASLRPMYDPNSERVRSDA